MSEMEVTLASVAVTVGMPRAPAINTLRWARERVAAKTWPGAWLALVAVLVALGIAAYWPLPREGGSRAQGSVSNAVTVVTVPAPAPVPVEPVIAKNEARETSSSPGPIRERAVDALPPRREIATVRKNPAASKPLTRRSHVLNSRCSDILKQASLESLSADELVLMRRECR